MSPHRQGVQALQTALAWSLVALGALGAVACARLGRVAVAPRPALGNEVVWHASLRLRCFGATGRLRTDGLLWLQRPDRFRLHVLGPQGGMLLALACDGRQVALYDAAAHLYRQGPASVAHLDKLMPIAPLHLSAAQWLDLWLGELAPLGAQVRRDGAGQLQQVKVAAAGQQPGWSLQMGERGAWRLPRRLAIEVEGGAGRCDITLEHGQLLDELPPSLFQMMPPPGAQVRGPAAVDQATPTTLE